VRLLLQLAPEIIQKAVPVFAFLLLFFVLICFQGKLNWNILLRVGVVHCFRAQKLDRNNPIFHLKICVTSEKEISHAFLLLILVKPGTST
jgi:hypothetical protein